MRHRWEGAASGHILIPIVLVIATAIAALATLSSGPFVSELRYQAVLEDESRAFHEAYAQLQLALNVVNASEYTEGNRNVELRDSMNGDHGGTVAGEPDTDEPFLRDPSGVVHGKIRSTDVRVYRGREYIERLMALRGETPVPVDPEGRSDPYYVLEATGRAGDVLRVVSALVRENEPFSSFVFFQNRHPLGISGAPRGLIHSNDRVDFYFPNGDYLDAVSAVNGFGYRAGAGPGNTSLVQANPEAERIELEAIDFAALEARANAFVGDGGLDAEIRFFADGTMRIRQLTPPRFEAVKRSWTGDVFVGWKTETVTEIRLVQTGIVQEERTRRIITGYDTETHVVDVPVYEEQEVERSREEPVYEPQEVERTRPVPIYELRTVHRTRWVQVFVPYEDRTGDGGGAAIGGDGGVPGEYAWVEEHYETRENVLVGYGTETYTTTEMVQVGTRTVTWTETVEAQVGTTRESRTRRVPVYVTETYHVDTPIYEDREVEVEREVAVYETQTHSWIEETFFPPVLVDTTWVDLGDAANTVFIDGRITRLSGDIRGRVTIVGNEKVRITGDLRYVDEDGDTAMLDGGDHTRPYRRNEDYDGNSVLGVVARDDILLTASMPDQAEINATLLSATGRVGIDGFAITAAGEPTKDCFRGLPPGERARERAYDATSYGTRRFRKDSLRRIGGVISNDRILETYIRPRRDGTSYVDAGFRRGRMRFDFSLLFNPPPGFVEVPRPVVTSIAPVSLWREDEG